MANKGVIDQLVDEKALKNFDELIKSVGIAKDEFGRLVAEAIKFNIAVGGSKTFKEFQAALDKTNNYLKKIPDATEKIRLSEVKLAKERERAFDRYYTLVQKGEQAALRQAARTAEQSRAFNVLAKSLSNAEKEALDLGVTFGASSKQFLDATKKVQDLRTQVDKLEQPLGKFQRNVGNYSGGFNGLSNSINQLTREFPSFANSVQTGFMALSNNFPIFFDEIKRTQLEIKTLRAQGQQVPGLFKQLTASIFSWGTALSIGITLITVFGKEIGNLVSAMFNGTKALNSFVENQKALGDVIKESNKSAGSQIANLKILTATARDRSLSDQERLNAVKELQKEFPKTFKNLSDEIILNGKDKEAIDATTESIIAQARARAAKEKLDEIEGKRLNNAIQKQKILNAQANETKRIEKDSKVGIIVDTEVIYSDPKNLKKGIDARAKAALDLVKQNDKMLESQSRFLTNFVGLNNLAEDIIDEDITKSDNKALRELLEFNKAKIEAVKRNSELIYTDETKSLDDRLNALKIFTEKSEELIKIDQKIQLTEADLSSIKRKTIATETKNRLIEIGLEASSKTQEIQKAANRELSRLLKEGTEALTKEEQDRILVIQEAGQDRLREIEKNKSEALAGLAEQYSNGLIKEEQYNEQLYDIEAQASADRLQIQIDHLKKEIEIDKEYLKFGIGTHKQLAIDEKKLTELEIEASNQATKVKIDNAKKVAEALKELRDKEIELGHEIFELTTSLIDGRFEKESQRNEKAIEDIDKQEEREKRNLEFQVLSKDEKEIKTAQIEARAQVAREQIEKRQRTLDIQRARFDKAASIGKIIANTAVAVTAQLAGLPFTAPLIAIISAIGAAQIGQVLATPIPKFKDGGTMKETGFAEYGHGTELRIDPDGKYSLTKPTPEIGIVEKGTRFVSNANLKRMIAKPEQVQYVGGQAVDINKLIEATENSSKRIEKAFSSRPEHKTVFTGTGMKYIIKNGSSQINYINKNLN